MLGFFLRGSKVQELRELREKKEKERKEEEERRRNEAEALPNHDRDHSLHRSLVLCSSCNSRLVLFLRVECNLCTLRGPLCYYMHIHLLHLSSVISFLFVKFNPIAVKKNVVLERLKANKQKPK